MADIKISQLASEAHLSATDVTPIVSNGVTKKTNMQAIQDFTIGTEDNSELGADVSTQINTLNQIVESKADADDVESEIQTLTNKLSDEVETRAKVSAHNFLPSTAVTDTINGVTFTVNSDKSVTVSTDSGGATADAVFPLCRNIKIKSGMIFKGCPQSGGTSKYYMAIEETSSPYYRYALDSGEGGEISASSDGNNFVYIRVVSGQILTTPITFYPMICLASDPSTEYVEYAMTNRELTKRQIGYVDISFSGVTPTSQDNTYIYAAQLPLEIRNTAEIIGAVFKSGTMFGLSLKYNVTTQNVYLESATNGALNTTVRVFYYIA